jgi:hypothetical protein
MMEIFHWMAEGLGGTATGGAGEPTAGTLTEEHR